MLHSERANTIWDVMFLGNTSFDLLLESWVLLRIVGEILSEMPSSTSV